MIAGVMANDVEKKEPIEAVIRAARAAYVARFGEEPEAAIVNEVYAVEAVDGLRVIRKRGIRPHEALVGMEV